MGNEVSIVIDKNAALGYEERTSFDFLRLPLLWTLALWAMGKKKIFGLRKKSQALLFDGLSPVARKVKQGATTWRALDIIYNYSPQKSSTIPNIITNFWNNIMNARALRNRLKLTKQKLRETLERFALQEKEVRLLSIACGSAQGVIEVIKEFKEKDIIVRVLLIDLDPTAIEYGKKLAKKAGVITQITFINKSVRVLEEAVGKFNPHVVEMVGFLEYRRKEKAVLLLNKIYRLLVPDGVLLTSHLAPNPETAFVKWVVGWPVTYRSASQFGEIIIKAEFDPDNCKIIYEPLRIHGVAICRKSNLLT